MRTRCGPDCHTLMSKTLHWLTLHPVLVGLLLLASTIASAWAATGMKFDFAPQSIFEGSGDLLEKSREFKKTFGHDDSVIQIILHAQGDKDVLEPAALDWQVSLAHDMDRLKDVVRVESLGSITTRKFSLSGSLGLDREPLIDVPADAQTETHVRDFLDHSHLIEGILVDTERKVAAILVFFDPKMQSADEMRTIVERLQKAVKDNPPPEGYRVYMTGQAVLRVDIVKNLQSDQHSLIPLAGLLYFAALFLAHRRLSGSVVPLAAVGIGLAWALGLFGITGQSFNLISNVLPMLLMVLGVNSSVHIIHRFAEEAQHATSRQEAAWNTMRHMVVACFLTFVTTVTGFASLVTAHSDMIQAFAWQSVWGLILLYIAIIITLTAALPWLAPPKVETLTETRPGRIHRWINGIAEFVTNRPRLTVAVSFVVMVLAIFMAKDVKINSYTLETYDNDHPTLKTIRLVERRLSGLFPLEIDLRVDDGGRFYEEDFVKKLAEVQRFAGEQSEIVFQRSYLNLHAEVSPPLRKLLTSSDADTSDLQSAIDRSQTRLHSAKEEMGYSVFMTPDQHRARLLLKVRDEGTLRTKELIGRLESKLKETFPEGSGVTHHMTGDAYVITMAMDQLIHELLWSLVTASAVIFVIIGVLFRSVRIGLAAAFSNTMPLVLTLGYINWQGYDMNAGNVIVFSISLGIVVDNTIHLIYRFQEEQRLEPDPRKAMRIALNTTAPAMVLTSLLIVGGLAVLMISQFVPTRRFAELMIVTLVGAMSGDLLILPACLVLMAPKPRATEGGTEAGDRNPALETTAMKACAANPH